VAWKFIQQLYEAENIPKEEGMVFLENAAFATVADVMELVEENRTIVALGLQQMQHTQNLGMQTLIARCGLEDKTLSAYHLGFVLGPCLNASGRLDTATKSLELLEAKTVQEASVLAETLQTLNEERKAMTEQGIRTGVAYVEQEHAAEDIVLVVYLPEVHESVAGLIAGKLREKYEHPVFVLTDAADGKGLKGSGRSVEGYSMHEEMTKCKELFDKFGGHPMAAGLSMPKENLDAFRRKINAVAEVRAEDLQTVIHIDIEMPFGYISPELIRELELLEPFGNGNPKPVFAQRNVQVVSKTRIGKNKQYLRMEVQDTAGSSITALYFGDAGELERIIEEKGCFAMTYYPQINVFRGQESLQIVIGNVI
jgi:single-stranded-DNA-specific exonuclease